MKAVVCRDSRLQIEEVASPEPGPGQLLIRVLRAGICGSDLHARSHSAELAALGIEMGYPHVMEPGSSVIFGHELVGEVVAYGPNTRRRWTPGTMVTALPIRRDHEAPRMIGFEERAPGAFAEFTVVQEAFTFEVPDGLSADLAVFTEPLAVAWHAVRRAEISKRRPAVVVGCGPIGLAVILMLKAIGVRHVVASDLSPARRELALACGADHAVDPAAASLWEQVNVTAALQSSASYVSFGIDAVGLARRVPLLPWQQVMRHAERFGRTPRGPVVFECVGIPGMIDQVIAQAPLRSRVVVLGVCMEPDTFRPAVAVNKEAELRFVFGYDPAEFSQVLEMLAAGRVDPRPLHTGTVSLDEVPAAFEELSHPDHHAKIVVNPWQVGPVSPAS